MGAEAAFLNPLAPAKSRVHAASWVLAALALHGGALAWIAMLPSTGAPPLPPTVISLALISPATRLPTAPANSASPAPPRPKSATPVRQNAAPQEVAATPAPTAAPPAPASPSNASTQAPPPLVAARFDADYLQNPAPAYPPLARRLGEQGRVVLRARVLPSGQAEVVEVKSTSGSPRLDAAALEAVRRWRFQPAHQGDEAVSSWVVIPISFSLEN